MKYIATLSILLLSIALTTSINMDELFTLDLSNGLSQFKNFSDNGPSYAQVGTDEGTKVIKFASDGTKYSGIITKDSIESPSGNYWILIEFKGELNKETGAYIGYERSTASNIQKTLGYDYRKNVEIPQLFKFKSNGTWNSYKAYLPLKKGETIKIILEQGKYYEGQGVDPTSLAMFKGLTVFDFTFKDECPGDDKFCKLGYFEFLFSNNELESKIYVDDELLGESNSTHGKLGFKFPSSAVPCINYAFYGLTSDNSVIEKFQPTFFQNVDFDELDQIDEYKYIFNMTDIETLGCPSEERQCMVSSALGTCFKYTCPIQFHLYFNNGNSFATKQQEYDYTSNNSLAIFNSSFSVIVNKQTQTVLNTLVKTKTVNTQCSGKCEINLDVTLELKYKTTATGTYQAFGSGSDSITVTWGDYIYIQITSNPSEYYLDLFQITANTLDGQEDLGNFYIKSYIQDLKSQAGNLTFKMPISGDAGLEKGKKFDLQFFTETKLSNGRLLEIDSNLPKVQMTGAQSFYAESSDDADPKGDEVESSDDADPKGDEVESNDEKKKDTTEKEEPENNEDSASKLALSLMLLFVLCLL